MVSNKKSYAMKLLQLALALSLLHVDPDNYLQQHFRNWDTQLELPDGDGWELEMLRAVPMVEYPYANRKTMMPLIEDLIRFDRQHEIQSQNNVTAYLLNVQTENSNQTAALQELQATANTPSTTPSVSSVALEHALEQASASSNTASNLLQPDLDIFLNSEHFQDHRSIWEQNLADLSDFGDLPVSNPYAGLPLKDEPLDNGLFDVNLEAFFQGHSEDSTSFGQESGAAVALNGSFPNPNDIGTIKLEESDNADEDNVFAALLTDDIASTSTSTLNEQEFSIKDEVEEKASANVEEVDLSPFISLTELVKEESEIVEVLWKQDVDLGYSLSPELQSKNNSDGNSNGNGCDGSSGIGTSSNTSTDDDMEKLKALEELKDDKSKFDAKDVFSDLGEEWAGIPFTIDNETGEYIRLPLDELLHDVIQLAELAGENNDINGDSVASTSLEAVGAAAKTDKKSSNENEDNNKENNKKKSNQNEAKLSKDDDLSESEIEVNSLPSPLFDLDDEAKEELADLDIMLQSAAPPFHHHHHHHHHHAHAHPHRPTATGVQNYAAVGSGANSAFHRQATGFHHGHHQGRMPLSRGVSMEQRLQDIASLFNPIPSMGVVGGEMPPYPHYPTHHYSYQGAAAIPAPPQHAQYPPPPPPPSSHAHHHGHHAMLHPNGPIGDICSTQPHYGHNLGSAVTSSMHLTNASHETDLGAGAAGGASNVGAYKMEHDMMYYSNASSDMNHTTDGFINSILNDEDLHLMDMNVTDNFCRMVDINNSTSNNSSVLGLSASHVSSGSGGSGGSGGGSTANNVLSMNAAGNTANGVMTSEIMSAGPQSGDRLDASSDSAVSSMGSERVPSLSDGEWGEGSDSAQDYHQGKYGGPYDYSYNNNTNNRLNDGTRQPPVAQKKHQMFGKRFLHEQPGVNGTETDINGTASAQPQPTNGLVHGPAQTIKYEYEPYPNVGGLQQNGNALGEGAMGPALSKEHHAYDLKYGPGAVGGYSLDFSLRNPRTAHDIVQHNHTYTLPQGTGSLPRPQLRDKKIMNPKSVKSANLSEEEHLTRDEKRARALNIPITVSDIINLPMDEFNERLSKYDLTENQLSLIRDIRRRGKNKVAAQNCRKRKLDQILSLEDEVKEVRRRKEQLFMDRDSLSAERKRISNKFSALHRHIFQYMRDPEGNPCSPSEYSLQQAADGSVYLLPRESNNNKTDVNNGITSGSGSTSHINQSQAPPQQQQQQLMHMAASQQQQRQQHSHQQQQHTLASTHPHQQQQHSHSHQHHHHQPHQKD